MVRMLPEQNMRLQCILFQIRALFSLIEFTQAMPSFCSVTKLGAELLLSFTLLLGLAALDRGAFIPKAYAECVSDCASVGSMPRHWSVTVSGLTSNACPDCEVINGTSVLTHIAACTWQSLSSMCSGYTYELTPETNTTWHIQTGWGDRYTTTAFVANGSSNVTFTRDMTAAQCSNTPTTITLVPSRSCAGAGSCGDGTVDAGEDCDQGANNGSSSYCCSSTCTYKSSGTSCRSSAGVCDVAETCTGSSGTCPSDSFLSSSNVCRSATLSCDPAENCTGSAAACPSDTNNCVCGNGVIDPGEDCDPPSVTNNCTNNCTHGGGGGGTSGGGTGGGQSSSTSSASPAPPHCGDFVVDAEEGEECDWGWLNNNLWGCSTSCLEYFCGDGQIKLMETCDNGSVCVSANGDDDGESCRSDDDCAGNSSCVYDEAADPSCTDSCERIITFGSSSSAGRTSSRTSSSRMAVSSSTPYNPASSAASSSRASSSSGAASSAASSPAGGSASSRSTHRSSSSAESGRFELVCYIEDACVELDPDDCGLRPVFGNLAVCGQAYADPCGNCAKCTGPDCTPLICAYSGWCEFVPQLPANTRCQPDPQRCGS